MTERYTGIPINQKFTRLEGGQAKATGGAFGRENRWQNARESQNPFSANREQTGSARENIHNLSMDRQQWLQSSRKGTLTEIRDHLRRQEIRQKLADMEAFSDRLNEKFNRKREEALAGTQEGEEKLTVGKLVLKLLSGLLAMPAEAAKQSLEESKRQAEQAA
jgi:hypothetical protein